MHFSPQLQLKKYYLSITVLFGIIDFLNAQKNEEDLLLGIVKSSKIPAIIDHTLIPSYVHMLNRRVNCILCETSSSSTISVSRIPRLYSAEIEIDEHDNWFENTTINNETETTENPQLPYTIMEQLEEPSNILEMEAEGAWMSTTTPIIADTKDTDTGVSSSLSSSTSVPDLQRHILGSILNNSKEESEDYRSTIQTIPPVSSVSSVPKNMTEEIEKFQEIYYPRSTNQDTQIHSQPRRLNGAREIMNSFRSTMSTFFQSVMNAVRQTVALMQDGMRRFTSLLSQTRNRRKSTNHLE